MQISKYKAYYTPKLGFERFTILHSTRHNILWKCCDYRLHFHYQCHRHPYWRQQRALMSLLARSAPDDVHF